MASLDGSLFCPDCGGVLVPYFIKTSETSDIGVNYCYNCGGFWCDHWVANKISYNKFQELARDLPLYDEESLMGGNGKCPYCFVKLQRLLGENIPSNLIVEACPQCWGNWFPKGELFRFKIAQESKLDYLKKWNVPLKSVYQVLLPIIILAVISASIPLTLNLFQQKTREQTIASEFVKNLQIVPSGVGNTYLVFNTNTPMISEVEYGLSLTKMQKIPVSIIFQTYHQVEFKNLISGSTYYYKIWLYKEGRVYVLPVKSFTVK